MAKKKISLTPEQRLQEALIPESEWPYQIPKNWCWVYWGACGSFTAGNGFKKEYQGYTEYPIPFYKVGSLKYSDSDGILYDNSNTISEEIRNILKASLIPSNSLIFAKIGEAIRLNRRSINSAPCCIDNNLMSFSAEACTPRYIYLWSLGIELYDYANATTVPAIRKSDLEIIPVPLAPQSEQQRIVVRIESLFAKLDEAKQKAQDVLDGFETRKAAILHKAFTGELTKAWRQKNGITNATWVSCTLGDVFELQAGKNIKADLISKQKENVKCYPCFGGNGIRGFVDHYNCEGEHPIIGRQGALCGNINFAFGQFYATEHAVVVSYKKDIRTSWALHYLKYLNLNQYATATAQPGLAVGNIKTVPMIYISYHEQNAVADILDSLLSKEQQAKEAAESVLEQIDLIKKSILARAFRGELGTNDPTEESSVELLKKIL